jgi:hypothetical protein
MKSIYKLLYKDFSTSYSLLSFFLSSCWKDGFNPAVVANHVDRPGYMLFRPASLRGFCPHCRISTLVNTSTVTIILCYCIILLKLL